MDNEKIILNILFIIFIVPALALIYYAYSNYFKESRTVNPENPYGLYISNFIVNNSTIDISVYNPSNNSISIYFTYLALKNSYQSSSIITSFSGYIYTINPDSSIELSYNYLDDQDTKAVILQWEKLGGYIYTTLYYSNINDSINGIINYEKT
ncbi:hypothetical protein MJ1_0052 [Nanobdella aerobiophila]|uniref:Uncharacterized protein n=1 Tax=Nanobdella aerobiophila TaxID=2586965 RepID=A0A915SS89_9ARCH|nr:hypothetical protein [Nanobdella aerobiophila]BBL45231.1 hypothetical protein MJ1_0052 [Nanobdella aerobiophila]